MEHVILLIIIYKKILKKWAKNKKLKVGRWKWGEKNIPGWLEDFILVNTEISNQKINLYWSLEMCLYSLDPNEICNHPECNVSRMVKDLYPSVFDNPLIKTEVEPFFNKVLENNAHSQR